ncbi:MAG: DinB family protein [Anaerolineae bacterium]
MPMFTPEKALRDFPKTPVILSAILQSVDQRRAQEARDGADGWNVLEVVCHLNDFEQIFFDRARRIVETDLPRLESVDQNALVRDNRYAEQSLAEALASYLSRRRAFIAFLRGLSAEQWQRKGIHYASGEVTLVDFVTNTTLHDVNHIGQILNALGSAPF